ncbi:MAG: PstC family ABC transporter permease [Chloroflexota bacterium]
MRIAQIWVARIGRSPLSIGWPPRGRVGLPSLTRVITMLVAFIPVGMLAAMIGLFAWNSALAVKLVGLPTLFSTTFNANYATNFTAGLTPYGLVPAMWGTLFVIVLTTTFAVPVSLAMALFASEFTLGPVGKAMDTVLGILSGIPPVVYGLLSIVVINLFIKPKFCAPGISEVGKLPGMTWYNPGMLPRELSSLTGCLLLALLIIPFTAPLMSDSIRSVPQHLREASLALGAGRWHTTRCVVLPLALPGIVAATSLGVLKAVGDLLIVYWAVGREAERMPEPLWDVFERVAPLTSTGAGLAGLYFGGGWKPLEGSVAYFTGLLLLVMAFGILAVSAFVQRLLRKRMQG